MSSILQIFTIVLVTAVIFVNGWTDAPNAIVGVVSTRTMRYKSAVWMAAVCNLLGILVMSAITASVADSITSMVNFSGNPNDSLAALCAAMLSIVIFAVLAWRFGIPTSESHALIAALTGAALALNQSAGIYAPAWMQVLTGLVLSVVLGFGSGWLATLLLGRGLQKSGERFLDRMQILSAGSMAFMHGAQDGQKFLAVFVIAENLVRGQYHSGSIDVQSHRLILVFCAVAMAAGTGMGGKRIIENVGGRMVSLQKHHAVCSDLGAAFSLLVASLFGIPTSTTHTRTTAIMGVGTADSGAKLDYSVMRSMLVAWIVTFPVCGLIGFFLTKLFLLQ